jgi:hypothetical protein
VANSPKGRRLRLTVARRIVADYMWASRGLPRVDVAREVSFKELIALRAQLREPPAWTAMFIKAFAIVAREIPELRRAYFGFPWAHFYEYAESTASIVQQREIFGDFGVLPIRIRQPDVLALSALSAQIRRESNEPIDQSEFNRRLLALIRLPTFIRRFLLGLALGIPRFRRYVFGTFGITAVGHWQIEPGTVLSPVGYIISYGPARPDGVVNVRLNFDHRLFDGLLVARTLARLDEVLNTVILDEMRAMPKLEATELEARALGRQQS